MTTDSVLTWPKRLMAREMQARLRASGLLAIVLGRMRQAALDGQLKGPGMRPVLDDVQGVLAGGLRYYGPASRGRDR